MRLMKLILRLRSLMLTWCALEHNIISFIPNSLRVAANVRRSNDETYRVIS